MSFENFSTKWFALYYITIALCLIGGGMYLVLKREKLTGALINAADKKGPPRILIRILKYFFLFTLPGIVLSFMPFSWIELLFTLWSLLLVYIAGIQLVRWNQSRRLIKAGSEKLPTTIRRSGAIMVAVGFAIFLLAFLVINRPPI
jgi:hypothetical protein